MYIVVRAVGIHAGSVGIHMRTISDFSQTISDFSHMNASVRFVLRLLFSDEVTMFGRPTLNGVLTIMVDVFIADGT
jgi:hypothetical protein